MPSEPKVGAMTAAVLETLGKLTLAPGAALTLGNGGAPGTSLTISAASGATNRFLSVAGGATSTGAAA